MTYRIRPNISGWHDQRVPRIAEGRIGDAIDARRCAPGVLDEGWDQATAADVPLIDDVERSFQQSV